MESTLLSLLIFAPVLEPTLGFNGTYFSLEIADTESEKEEGLMNRETLPEDRGMLFVFSEEDYRSFWMKNTSIPLDMVFMDSNFEVLNIEEADPEPETSKEELDIYESEDPARYVLEVNQNRSGDIGLQKGDEMRLGLELRPLLDLDCSPIL